jgi:hypothetical protein
LPLLAACTTGEGDGYVRSERLYVEDCWNGAFNLRPTFFGANPFSNPDSTDLFIRVQRGDNTEEVSDGVLLVVKDVERLRQQSLGQPLELALPPEVRPPGAPFRPRLDGQDVSLALYLMDSCQAQNGILYAVGGTITFDALFSGNANENSADDRLTEATFEATVVDPRTVQVDGTYPAELTSVLSGKFRFFFQRGQPAQPFP